MLSIFSMLLKLIIDLLLTLIFLSTLIVILVFVTGLVIVLLEDRDNINELKKK